MSKNIAEIPYTEIVERVTDITRSPENAKSKIRGTVQDTYCREVAYKYDWNFLFTSTSIITNEKYDTGTVSINTGSSTATFSSDVTLTVGMTGRKIKISGNDVVYDLTYATATSATLTPSFQGPANASSNSYTIFDCVYPLPTDFDRFPKDGGIYKWIGGKKEIIHEEPYQEYARYFQASPTTPEKVRLVGSDTSGRQLVEFRPPPDKARVYGCDYIKKVLPLSDTTAGTVTISAEGTTVTGSTSCKFTDASTGDWLRIDAFGTGQDSTWYKVINISHDSSLTLHTAFANSGVTDAGYTIAKAPDFPVRLHPAVVFGSVKSMALDQNDQSFTVYIQKYGEIIADANRLYVSRIYDQKIQSIAEEYMYRR